MYEDAYSAYGIGTQIYAIQETAGRIETQAHTTKKLTDRIELRADRIGVDTPRLTDITASADVLENFTRELKGRIKQLQTTVIQAKEYARRGVR